MFNFSLIKSPDEIVEALNGNGYNVALSSTYINKKGQFKAPKVANMNKDGLSLDYYNEAYPDKQHLLWVENEFEIETHKVFNERLIKYMFKTYGDLYLEKVKNYLLNAILLSCKNKNSTYISQRLKDELQPYMEIYKNVKAEQQEISEEAKIEQPQENAGGGIKTQKPSDEAE